MHYTLSETTLHTQKQRWKAKRTGVVGVRRDRHASKMHFESSEKHSTVRVRAHTPEMGAFTAELPPETSDKGKQLFLSLLRRRVPRAQVPGGHITWLCCFRGLLVCASDRQSDKPESKHQGCRSAEKYNEVFQAQSGV